MNLQRKKQLKLFWLYHRNPGIVSYGTSAERKNQGIYEINADFLMPLAM
jgi:hypothetical protein